MNYSEMSIETLRKEANEWRNAIFAYEMSGEINRIDYANKALDAIYAELKNRNSQD